MKRLWGVTVETGSFDWTKDFKTLDWPKSSLGFFCKLNITPWMYAVRG